MRGQDIDDDRRSAFERVVDPADRLLVLDHALLEVGPGPVVALVAPRVRVAVAQAVPHCDEVGGRLVRARGAATGVLARHTAIT
jgi:hypothetical protein